MGKSQTERIKDDLVSSVEGISFGLVDGSICALGAVVGIVTATNDMILALVALLIFGLSDSFGNAAGFYLSQVSERNVQLMRKRMGRKQHVHTEKEVLLNGVFTFVATFLVYGLIALPFAAMPRDYAIISAILIASVITFVLGSYNADLVGQDRIRIGLFYSSITVATAIICYLFGLFLNGLMR